MARFEEAGTLIIPSLVGYDVDQSMLLVELDLSGSQGEESEILA